MPLRDAVLALVIERPAYGYALTQRLEQRVGLLRASKNAVYPALKKLSQDGLIRERVRPTSSQTATSPTWYEATDAGREYFTAWIRAASHPAPLRDDLHLKVAFAPIEELPGLLEQTRAVARAYAERIEILSKQDDGDEAADKGEWVAIGGGWLRRTEIAYLTVAMEALHDAEEQMEHVLGTRTHDDPEAPRHHARGHE